MGEVATITHHSVAVERSGASDAMEIAPAAEKLVPFPKLESEFGITYGRVQIWRLMRDGKFPIAVRTSEGGRSAWLESEIRAWIRSRPRVIAEPKNEARGRRRRRR